MSRALSCHRPVCRAMQPAWAAAGLARTRPAVRPRLLSSTLADGVTQPQQIRDSCRQSRTRITRKSLTVCASASAGAVPLPTPAPAPAPTPTLGIKVVPALIAIALGVAVRFLIPVPAGLAPEAWSLLSIFISTIAGLVLGPMPVGAWAFCALTVTIATKTLPFRVALSAMTSEVIWLIVISFFFAKGFDKTGLGERIANLFVVLMGQSTLGLAYGLQIAETLMTPALPSTTARAGGIFVPIIRFLSKGAGSTPEKGRKRLGAFLVQSQLQSSSYNSALFLSSGGQNLLCISAAAALGVEIPNVFATWFIGALPQAIIGLLITPVLLYYVYPPEVKDTPEAPGFARERLAKMGPMSRDEKVTLATISGAVVLWVGGEAIGCSAVLAAMIALCVLLISGVLTWRDCLEFSAAWDTLMWFAVLIGMSNALSDSGLITLFANQVGQQLLALNLGWPTVFVVLHLAFFTVHYLFASQTAHIGALYAAFLAMMLAAGVPGMLAALTLAYNGNLFGCITHFASGQSAIYYGSGFNSLPEFFTMGALFGFLSLFIYIGVGWPWWKFLGWC